MKLLLWVKKLLGLLKMNKGYTGRKLDEYTWIPKSKTYLREYREFLKICYDVQKRDGSFNDRTVGAEMVKRRAIVDRDNTAESYIEKYDSQTIGNQSYVSNARMMIRICRWLGWMTIGDAKATFVLTPYGINLTSFEGAFPAKIADLDEYSFVEAAFAKMKFYSVNDSPQYRNPRFKQRIFLNMLKVLSLFDHCSHYELVVSAFILKDERNHKEYKKVIGRVKRLKDHKITIGKALAELNLDCNNKSSVTGVYDGPKVMLSFARQLGLVENIPVSKETSPEIYEEYSLMYKDSGHIKPHGIKFVSSLTDIGKDFVEKYSKRKIIWFDELDDKLNESTLLVYLNKSKKSLDVSKIGIELKDAIANLSKKDFIKKNGDYIKLSIETDFDLFQDVPFESRIYVIGILRKIDKEFLSSYNLIVERMKLRELFVNKNNFKIGDCIYCAVPSCKIYSQMSNQYGASDRFADRVCPMDIIQVSEKGEIIIEEDKCINCMLCVGRCPFSALSINEGKLRLKKSDNYLSIEYSQKIKETENLISQKGVVNNIQINTVAKIINLFESKISVPGHELKKDQFYVLVRNYFRGFGFEAAYSGSGGMKTRSDVTLLKPYIITSEVKSPAEGPINLKAVRQAFHAAVQQGTQLTLAIGDTTHKGAIEEEEKFRKVAPQVKICLLEIKYLFFLYLVRNILKISAEDINNLLMNNPGYFTKEKIEKFVKHKSAQINLKEAVIKEIIKELHSI